MFKTLQCLHLCLFLRLLIAALFFRHLKFLFIVENGQQSLCNLNNKNEC